MRHWKSLVVFTALTLGVAAIGSLSSPDAWYEGLAKPPFNPPGWIFGPVWTVLYLLMAVAAWRVWRKVGGWSLALSVWLLQLLINGLWSPLFFTWHRIDLAFLDIIALDLAVIATMALFHRHDRVAAGLLVPYLAWISFATVLTFSIWRLNP